MTYLQHIKLVTALFGLDFCLSPVSMNKLAHPLGGCDFNSYVLILLKHHPLDPKQWKRLLLLGIWNLLRSPSSWLEDWSCRSKISNLAVPDNPVFIIGHWRSGTTYLFNVLARDEQFHYIKIVHQILPWNFLNRSSIWVRLLAKDLPEKRQVILNIETPAEGEMAWGNMGLPSMTYGHYFPQLRWDIFRHAVLFEGISPQELEAFAEGHQYFYKKVLLENPNKRLLIKNPANTAARMGWLKKLYPKAQFIHIYRNPFCVFPSMMKAGKRVLPIVALQPYDTISQADLELSALKIYRSLYERFFEEEKRLPKEDLYQLRFEDFEANPISEIAKIYHHFNWSNWHTAQAVLEQYCAQARDYQKGSYTLTPRQVALIKQHWGFTLEHWGYTFPDSILVQKN